MSKTRAILAGGALIGLTVVPAFVIPATAATSAAPSSSTSSTSQTDSTSATEPLVSLCLTVTPKSVAIGINGQDIVIGPAGVPRSCIATPF